MYGLWTVWSETGPKKKKKEKEIPLGLSFMFVYSTQPKINSLMTRVTSNLIDSNVWRVYFVCILLCCVMWCLILIDRIRLCYKHTNLNISMSLLEQPNNNNEKKIFLLFHFYEINISSFLCVNIKKKKKEEAKHKGDPYEWRTRYS